MGYASPAVLFGLAHTYQGYDLVSSLAAFGVTFIGALYFSWMYAAWDFNLWVVFGLHFLMNAAWVIFNVTGTEVAAGGLISNIVRIISMALAIGITIYYHKKKERKFLIILFGLSKRYHTYFGLYIHWSDKVLFYPVNTNKERYKKHPCKGNPSNPSTRFIQDINAL